MSRCTGCASSGTASRRATSPTNDGRPRLKDLLLPRTDAGALVQAIAAAMLFSVALIAVRRNRDLLWFVAGLACLTFAGFALRAVH
jgi:hypothetical protein